MQPISTVGFLHDSGDYHTKPSLACDFQEPFRWIADVTAMDAFESRKLDLSDFYFTGDDHGYRFEPEAKQRFLDLLRERFNSPVNRKGRAFKRDTVIEQKTAELGRYLVGRTSKLDFIEPSADLHRVDDNEIRRRILNLTQHEAEMLEIGKSTLHYLRRSARGHESFRVYERIREKFGSTGGY